MPFELTSPTFQAGTVIPNRFSCLGEDVSPELNWGDPPAGTQSFALIFDDPDGGGWVHWIIFNIPPDARGLPEAVPASGEFALGALQGINSWNELGYGGPCPPPGSTHLYVFTLYSLDAELNLEAGATKRDLQLAMDGHILAQTELSADFSR